MSALQEVRSDLNNSRVIKPMMIGATIIIVVAVVIRLFQI